MSGVPAFRDWQNRASDLILDLWRISPGRKPLVAGCPGCGKTIFGSGMGKIAKEDFGCGIILCVSPTVNVKQNWKNEGFKKYGLKTSYEVDNQSLKEQIVYAESLIGDFDAICITYQQLAQGKNLFAEMLQRHRGLLIADEPHHADENEKYGEALNLAAEAAKLHLALTGTPFNTKGRPLAMIESEEGMDPDGTRVRRSVPTFKYSYAEAIDDGVCRPLEFVTVMGRGEVTYRSLIDQSEWTKIIDLARGDPLTHLLAPEGDFLPTMLETGVQALVDIKKTDKRAAMLVAVKDIEQGHAVGTLLEDYILEAHPEWPSLQITKVFHDNPGASKRINELKKDRTDIIIAVRMISEGVDIPRLRVGVYASNYLTRLFFIQLVGRFIRYEARLDEHQFAKMIIPNHKDLLPWAREIEKMIAEAKIAEESEPGEPGEPRDPSEIVRRETSAGEIGAILRGAREEDISLASDFFRRAPSAVGRIPDLLATLIMRDLQIDISIPAGARASSGSATPPPRPAPEPEDLRKTNKKLVQYVVHALPRNGQSDEEAFRFVQGQANKAAGIPKLNRLTTDAALERRAAFLRGWLADLRKQEFPDDVS